MFGGLLGSVFGCNNEMDEKPRNPITSMSIEIPKDATEEERQRFIQYMQDKAALSRMTPREQLEYLKNKNGL